MQAIKFTCVCTQHMPGVIHVLVTVKVCTDSTFASQLLHKHTCHTYVSTPRTDSLLKRTSNCMRTFGI